MAHTEIKQVLKNDLEISPKQWVRFMTHPWS